MKNLKSSVGVVLVEYHNERMKARLHRWILVSIVLFGFCLAVPLYFYNDREIILAGHQIFKSRADRIQREILHYQLKDRILSLLRTKPLTISQGIDVCDVILTQKDVPAAIIFALLEQESKFKADAISYKGAKGIAQVMPATFKAYNPNPLIKNLMDPATNMRASISYLSELFTQYKDWKTVLRIYQAGPQNAKNKEFDWYANSVLARAAIFEQHLF
jgi:hypothetical protein